MEELQACYPYRRVALLLPICTFMVCCGENFIPFYTVLTVVNDAHKLLL
jgi:hypothetical protein